VYNFAVNRDMVIKSKEPKTTKPEYLFTQADMYRVIQSDITELGITKWPLIY